MPSATRQPRHKIVADLQRAQRLQGAYSVMHGATIAALLDIGAVDLECLDLLLLHGPLPAGQLAAQAGLGATTMTSVIDRLESAGFVTRERDSIDRRIVLVRIVPDSLNVIRPHYEPIVSQTAKVQSAFTNAELSIVARYIQAAASATAAAVAELRDRHD